MKKICGIVVVLFICLFFTTNKVSASSFKCEYKHNMTTITYKYEYGKKLSYSVSSDKFKKQSSSLKNENFYNETTGEVFCPKVKINTTPIDKGKYSITITPSSEGISGTMIELEKDDKELNNDATKTIYCGYEKGSKMAFEIYWDSGLKINTIGDYFVKDGYKYSISGEFVESDFVDGKCPQVYTQLQTKAKNIIISKEKIFSDNDKPSNPSYIEDSDGNKYDQPGEENLESGDIISDKCEVIPREIRRWINNILNFVRYVALALVIALGALDFMKAAGSGEPDAMKKAGQSFVKRVIAVAILFLVPVIVDFILNMINIYGVNPDNINCLK